MERGGGVRISVSQVRDTLEADGGGESRAAEHGEGLLRAPSPLGGDAVGEGTAQAGGGSGKKDAPAADDGLEGPWGERGEGGGGGGGGGREPGPPGSTVLLLCLNWHTFTDANGMLAALTKRALDEHIPITLVHEQDESMGGCPFRMFLDQTPLELQQPQYNLFRTLAVPYFSGSDFLCTVSRRYTLRSIGAKPLLGRHSVPAAPRLRQPGPLVMSQRPVAHHYVYGV